MVVEGREEEMEAVYVCAVPDAMRYEHLRHSMYIRKQLIDL